MKSTNSNLYLPSGSNAALRQPFVDLKDPSIEDKTIIANPLNKQLKAKYDELIKRDEAKWRSMIAIGQIIAFFIEGEQILTVNQFTGLPQIDTANRKNPLHIKAINKMQGYCTVWQNKWETSNADTFVAPFSNDDRAAARTKKANAVIDYLESQFFTPRFNLHEGLMAQIWGWYGEQVRPDHTAKSFSAFKEIWKDKQVPIGKGFGKCVECGFTDEKEHQQCPECGGQYQYDSPIMQFLPQMVGKEKMFLPEIVCEQIPFPAARWDLTKTIEESDWAIIEKKIPENALRRIISKIRFPEGESGNEFGLDAIETIARRGASMDGRAMAPGTESGRKEITLSSMYLGADDLYDIKIPKDAKTVEGHTLPKGKRMSDVYPDGCHIIGINGMAMHIGIYDEHHRNTITSGVYHMKPMSGAGRGVADAIPIQTQFNRRYSQYDRQMAARATPPILAVENAIEPRYRKMLSRPDVVIPVKLQNFPDVRSLQQLIAPLQAQSVDGGLVSEVHDRLDSMLQFAYHTTGLGGINQSGVENDTATYAQIADSNSDAIFSPVLTLKADCRMRTTKNGFNLWTEYTPLAKFIPFKQSKSGAKGIEISGEDVKGEYQWSYARGSEAPKTRFSEQQKKAAFFNLFGGAAGWIQARTQFPKEVAELERDFDVDFETDTSDTVAESCRRRFEQARQELGRYRQAQAQPDFLSIIASVKPSMLIVESALPDKAAWFQMLLDTDEGQSFADEERDLAAAFILAFRELAKGQTIEIQKEAAEIQVASQKPLLDAQNEQEQMQMAQSAEQQGMQNSQAQAQAEQEQLLQVADKAAELGDREAQRNADVSQTAMQSAATVAAAEAQARGKQNA